MFKSFLKSENNFLKYYELLKFILPIVMILVMEGPPVGLEINDNKAMITTVNP